MFQQEEPKPVKRLRLIQKPAQPELRLNLQSGSTSQEVLHALVTLEQRFPIEQAVAERIFPELMEQYSSSRDTLVRSKILGVFAKLAAVPGFNPQVISDQLLPKLQTEGRFLKLVCSLLVILINGNKCVCVCTHVSVHVFACVYIICVCVCVCVCVYVCVVVLVAHSVFQHTFAFMMHNTLEV